MMMAVRTLMLAAALAGSAVALSAAAADPAPQAGSIAAERAAMRRALDQAEAAGKRSAALARRAQAADADAERARREAQAVAARIQQAEAQIDAAEARVAIIAALERAQAAQLARRQEPIVRLTAALQTLARRPVALSLVQPGSLDDMVRVRAVLATVLPRIRARTRALRAEIARSKQLRRAATGAAALLRQSRAALDTERAALAKLETRHRAESRALAGNARLEEERALGLGEAARDIGDLVDRIEAGGAVRDRLAALDGPMLRPGSPGGATGLPRRVARAAPRQPAYRLPVVGAVVTGLGEVSASGVRARGLTIATRPAAQAVAPAPGRIAFAGPYRGFGRIIIIEHEGDWTSLITGLAATSVRLGEQVEQGDPIGRAGTDRPQVTVELRRAGRPVDIVPLLE